MRVTPVRTRLFVEGELLADFICKHIPKAEEETILVVTSKIVALAENRVYTLRKDMGESEQWDALVRHESDVAIKTAHAYLTIAQGMLLPNAGIDKSNAEQGWVLLPKDSYSSAARLRDELCERFKVRKLGVLISDSRVAPLRAGTTAVCLGYAGIEGVRDYRGTKDLYGRTMQISRTNVVDSLCTAATLCMGEGSEQQPLAIITDAPVVFTNVHTSSRDVTISPEDDLYRPLISKI